MNMKEYLIQYIEEVERKRKIVSSEEYVNWLYNYVSMNKCIDDESALYLSDDTDVMNGKILSDFFTYVKELAKEQRVRIVSKNIYSFENAVIAIKIKDKYFEVLTMSGQGSWTSVSLLKGEPQYAYVKIQ